MGYKFDIQVKMKTSVRCPGCQEAFEKPAGDETSLQCPHCGRQFTLPGAASAIAADGETPASDGPENARLNALTKSLNALGIVAGLWLIIFPFPYRITITVCACIPIAAFLVMALHKGMICLATKKGSAPVPSLTSALALPSMALALRTLKDFHILVYDHVWIPMIAICVIYSLLIYFWSAWPAELKASVGLRTMVLIFVLFIGFGYGYGTVVAVNCLTDHSSPKAYTTVVFGKRISSGKSTSYYITVSPWGPQTTPQEISISRREYDRIKENDELLILLRNGTLGIPWFAIQPNGVLPLRHM